MAGMALRSGLSVKVFGSHGWVHLWWRFVRVAPCRRPITLSLSLSLAPMIHGSGSACASGAQSPFSSDAPWTAWPTFFFWPTMVQRLPRELTTLPT